MGLAKVVTQKAKAAITAKKKTMKKKPSAKSAPSKTSHTKNRKVDVLGGSKGSTANKLRSERKRRKANIDKALSE